MNKLLFLLIFLGSCISYSQINKIPINKWKFENDAIAVNVYFFKSNTVTFDFSKQEKPFSIYNPKPGFNTFSRVASHYYSFENTNRLLSYEMKDIKKEPIFPEIKKESLGEAIFSGIIDSIFDK